MSYPTHDTDWAESQQGNYWRRVNGVPLIVGKRKHERYYWASVDSKFMDEIFNSLGEAQLAAEKELERIENNFCPPSDYER